MGDWSPETTSAVWRGGATGPTLGARFRGTNQKGSKKWRSNGTVTVCEPGRRFAFHVSIGPFSVADWAYEFEPAEEGCVVTELWEDRRGAFVTAAVAVHHRDEGPRASERADDDRDPRPARGVHPEPLTQDVPQALSRQS
jgi:Polyketide cyclase / dehydrase and lipid transport